MNGIPTTFNDGLPAYTAVGGERFGNSGISAVLLGCGGQIGRASLYHSLKQAGFDWILSIEENEENKEHEEIKEHNNEENGTKRFASDISQLAEAYPFVRFVLLREPLPAGSQINLAATELLEHCFLVLRKDCVLDPSDYRIAGALAGETQNLCAVPLMFDKKGDALPVQPLFYSQQGRQKSSNSSNSKGIKFISVSKGINVSKGITVPNVSKQRTLPAHKADRSRRRVVESLPVRGNRRVQPGTVCPAGRV